MPHPPSSMARTIKPKKRPRVAAKLEEQTEGLRKVVRNCKEPLHRMKIMK